MKNKRITMAFAALLITASSMSMDNIIAMSEKHPFNITAEKKDKIAEVRISGVIWNWGNSAAWFRQQIEAFNKNGINHMKLHINTPGGSVFEANEIYNEIEAFEGTVEGIGGALVASAGTYIALACDTFTLPSNGSWMYHKPMGRIEGNEDKIQADLQLLKNLTAQYRKAYSEKTTLSEDQIEKNWAKGDVWLNPEKALKDGFITGIRKSKVKVDEETTALFAACSAPDAYKPKPQKEKSKTKTTNTMEDHQIMALQLGMDKNSTKEQVEARVKELQAKAAEADTLKAEKTAKEKADKDQAVTALIDGAVKEKKITAAQAEGLKSWATNDFEACKKHIEGLQPLGKISESIKGNATPSAAAAAVADKKFEAMTTEEQDTLAKEDPDAFRAKYNAYLEGLK
jgi:ATP-dependent protease ClpP protease subunit